MTTVVEEFVAKLGWEIDTREFKRFQDQARGIRDDARRVFRAGVVAAGLLGTAIYKAGSAFSVFEDAEAAFTPMLKGADKAKLAVEALIDMAAKTPFQFEQLAGAAQLLLPSMNGNIQQTIATTRMLGDVAGGNARRMESVVRGFSRVLIKGKADMESLNIIAEAQVPIFSQMQEILGYKTGKQMFDAMRLGKIGVEDLTKVFRVMTSEGGMFYKGMEIASQTLSGRISTLKDDWTQAMGAFGGAIAPVLKELVGEADEITKRVKGWAVANKDLIATQFREFVNDLRAGLKWLFDNRDYIVTVGKDLAILYGGIKVLALAGTTAKLLMTANAITNIGKATLEAGSAAKSAGGLGGVAAAASSATTAVKGLATAIPLIQAALIGIGVGTLIYDSLVEPWMKAKKDLERMKDDFADTTTRDLSKRSVAQLERDVANARKVVSGGEEFRAEPRDAKEARYRYVSPQWQKLRALESALTSKKQAEAMERYGVRTRRSTDALAAQQTSWQDRSPDEWEMDLRAAYGSSVPTSSKVTTVAPVFNTTINPKSEASPQQIAREVERANERMMNRVRENYTD